MIASGMVASGMIASREQRQSQRSTHINFIIILSPYSRLPTSDTLVGCRQRPNPIKEYRIAAFPKQFNTKRYWLQITNARARNLAHTARRHASRMLFGKMFEDDKDTR